LTQLFDIVIGHSYLTKLSAEMAFFTKGFVDNEK